MIANSVRDDHSRGIIDDFVAHTGTQVVSYVPRSAQVTQAELAGKTVIEAAPQTAQAAVYQQLATRIFEHEESKVPEPLELDHLRQWASKWANVLIAAEQGQQPVTLAAE